MQGTPATGKTNTLAQTAFVVGCQGTTHVNKYAGGIDEVRVSSVARSADWILASYNNQSSPSTFYSTNFVSAISGNAGVAGATVSYSGTALGSVTADGSGNYVIINLANGSYTITPSKTGYTFSPTSASETVNGANITGVDFGATQTLVATPTFSPAAGAYGPTQNVTISDTDYTLTGFQIYYTTNGDTPDNTKTAYTYGTTVAIASSCTLKAIAYATGYANSAVGSAAYTINGACGTPTFSPAAGTYTSAQTVTISSTTAGASIYWNTTGSPTSSDTLYTGPITVSASETIYAIAEKAGYVNSAVGSAAYVINIPSGGGGAAWLMADQSSLEDIPRRRGH